MGHRPCGQRSFPTRGMVGSAPSRDDIGCGLMRLLQQETALGHDPARSRRSCVPLGPAGWLCWRGNPPLRKSSDAPWVDPRRSGDSSAQCTRKIATLIPLIPLAPVAGPGVRDLRCGWNSMRSGKICGFKDVLKYRFLGEIRCQLAPRLGLKRAAKWYRPGSPLPDRSVDREWPRSPGAGHWARHL